MIANSVSICGLVLSAVLIVITILVSSWHKPRLGREIAFVCVRAATHLTIVGTALHLVVDDDPLVLSWLWIVGMIVFTSITTQRRVGSEIRATLLGAGSFGVAVGTNIAVLFGLQVFPLEGRALVPWPE